MRRIVVKLGSSVVADGDGEPREEVLRNVCDALAALPGQGAAAIVVTLGHPKIELLPGPGGGVDEAGSFRSQYGWELMNCGNVACCR